MIVDDDDGGRNTLYEYLSADKGIEIITLAKDGKEALCLIETKKPDLVFMDIDMPHLSGIDVARNLVGHWPLIIFATAFDRYAIHAFEVNAVDYILKPFTKDRVEKSLVRARAMLPRKADYAYEKYLLSQESFAPRPKISFKDGNDLLIMNMDAISCIETEGRYVRVYYDGISHIFDESLLNIFFRLNKEVFVYASRGIIVNLAHVTGLTYHGVRKFSLMLDDPAGKTISIARDRVGEIKKRLTLFRPKKDQ